MSSSAAPQDTRRGVERVVESAGVARDPVRETLRVVAVRRLQVLALGAAGVALLFTIPHVSFGGCRCGDSMSLQFTVLALVFLAGVGAIDLVHARRTAGPPQSATALFVRWVSTVLISLPFLACWALETVDIARHGLMHPAVWLSLTMCGVHAFLVLAIGPMALMRALRVRARAEEEQAILHRA